MVHKHMYPSEDLAPRRQPRRVGMTLIEVLVAMVILGTMLATAVTARGRYMVQAARAAQKNKAVSAADSLLADWSLNWESNSSEATGKILSDESLSWQRSIVDRPGASELQCRVLRLVVWDNRSPGGPGATEQASPAVLASVEVVVPIFTPKPVASNLDAQAAINRPDLPAQH